ncbi:MAG TPA: hypothetical protein VER96_00655 [Polyangiaceae bacterium]|nr:hypothetical protein [Polyangiaceae bacterium]
MVTLRDSTPIRRYTTAPVNSASCAANQVSGLLTQTLAALAASAICLACGGSVRTSVGAGGTGPDDAASGADGGALPTNARRSHLACGATSTCLLTAQTGVRCWGIGADGQLGNGLANLAIEGPTPVEPLSPAVGLIGGPLQTCAFAASDAAECWGLLPSLATNPTTTPTQLALAAVATIAFSGHACAVTRAGDVYCWGPDEFLGNGSGPSESPQLVAGIHDAIDVAVATDSDLGSGIATLVVRADGTVLGWGHANGPGLTSESRVDQLTPIPMPGLSSVKQLTLGLSHACALLEDAHVACWGSNFGGRLGSSSSNTLVPQLVTGLTDVVEVRAGETFTCARRTNGEVRCWGENTFHALAQPQERVFSRVPVHIDVPPVSEMAVGQGHVCVLTGEGDVWCWGNNYSGQITNSDQVTFDTPVLVSP